LAVIDEAGRIRHARKFSQGGRTCRIGILMRFALLQFYLALFISAPAKRNGK
jgi:hypothetical protein